MPMLSLRTVGMSYLIEGIAGSGLDPEGFRDAMGGRYGVAMAVLGTPRSPEAADPDASPAIDGIIVDRKAVPRDALMAWLLDFVRLSGHSYASWAGDGREGSATMLHFHP